MKAPKPRDVLRDWPERERRWRRKLGRIRLGAEPIAEQVQKYLRVTWALTAVCCGVALIFLALFAAFRAPLLGLGVAAILLGPVVLSSWVGFARMRSRAARYLREKEEVERLRASRKVEIPNAADRR